MALSKPTRFKDEQLQHELDRIVDAIRRLQAAPLPDGHLIEGVNVTTGTAKLVNHGLGRAPRGYVVVKRSANTVIWDEATPRPTEHLQLQASASVTVSLWVF